MAERADELVPILRVENAETAVAWYARLGFVLEGVHRFEPGLPAYAFLKVRWTRSPPSSASPSNACHGATRFA